MGMTQTADACSEHRIIEGYDPKFIGHLAGNHILQDGLY